MFTEETDDYVTMWDQTVINDGRLRYVQSEPNKTVDSMHFDVTNGVRTLRDLRIDFIVIPTALLLASNPLVVNEGNVKTRLVLSLSLSLLLSPSTLQEAARLSHVLYQIRHGMRSMSWITDRFFFWLRQKIIYLSDTNH